MPIAVEFSLFSSVHSSLFHRQKYKKINILFNPYLLLNLSNIMDILFYLTYFIIKCIFKFSCGELSFATQIEPNEVEKVSIREFSFNVFYKMY